MKNKFFLFALLVVQYFQGFCKQQADSVMLHSAKGGWTVTINEKGGITSLSMLFNNKLVDIPWRRDEHGGPVWAGVKLQWAQGSDILFEGRKNDQVYSLQYKDVEGKLTLVAELKNNAITAFRAEPAVSIRLGINNEMKDTRAYYGIFFPTLLRCEKNHFWGYFQNPNGNILTITSPDPVASRTIEYISQGHRIYTSTLDVLHALPLPTRHPQQLVQLAAGESKIWTIVFEPASTMNDVLPIVASNTNAAAIALNRTTVSAGEILEATINFIAGDIPTTIVFNSSGKKIKTSKPVVLKNTVKHFIKAPSVKGNYKIVTMVNGKQSEAIFHVRNDWGWYLKQARTEALRMQIKPMQHREGWLGFFSAYAAQVYFPDKKLLAKTEKIFEEFYKIMVDSTGIGFDKKKPTWHDRPQNTAWMVGMLAARYAATKKMEDLELAAKWANHFIEKFQLPNGSYKGYTALTMGSKFLEELAFFEKPFINKNSFWKQCYENHILSIERASQNLLKVKDLEDTEGEATYEDTQAGSAWSLLALQALNTDIDSLRKKYTNASIEVQRRHECLTQALIPDARMRNATLRFWESQYDVLMLPNMMNSPHGWTMRSQFGAFYLYLLTGEEFYLNLMNNAMGACVQAIDESTGVLRWAFVPDPYINVLQLVPDLDKPMQGKYIRRVVGEEWIPMISDWWRVPKGEIGVLQQFKNEGLQGVSQGWSCDNDVHETFRILAEEFIPNAFVLEREDGSIRTMNCTVERKGNILFIKLPESVVTRVHLNLKNTYSIVVPFANKTMKQKFGKGLHWVGPGGVPELFKEKIKYKYQ